MAHSLGCAAVWAIILTIVAAEASKQASSAAQVSGPSGQVINADGSLDLYEQTMDQTEVATRR